jgi:cation diffusion facilitator CzcD-associated flavoprotein CzcO
LLTSRSNWVDAVIVGAGFAGMYQLHKLRELGLQSRVLERGSGVGGTWFWNRYPGAHCDAPAQFYTVSYRPDLDQEWTWSHVYAPQAKILEYMEEVARREDRYKDISFDTSVVGATWSDDTARWTSTTNTGETITSRYLIMATGALSDTRVPDIRGLDTFEGRWFHTGRWPHEPVSFSGRRVAVVGTGSTGVQTIPIVAAEAAEVLVLQRTPKFVLPALNRELTHDEVEAVRANYATLRAEARRGDFGMPFPTPPYDLRAMSIAEREELMEELFTRGGLGGFVSSYRDHLGLKSQEVNDIVSDFVRKKIREIVKDSKTAEALIPYGYPIGINRIILGTDYYETFNRDNVTLHSVLDDPIIEVKPTGLQTAENYFEFDDLIFATGYDGMTGSFTSVDIRSRAGESIKDRWADGPTTYLGMQVSEFPNLFIITGPGGPSVLANVVVTTEQSIDFVAALIRHAQDHGLQVIETDADSETRWMEHVAEVAEDTLYRYASKANSWYTGANVPGKKVVFMPYAGGVGTFETVLKDVAEHAFRGFGFSRAGGTETKTLASG